MGVVWGRAGSIGWEFGVASLLAIEIGAAAAAKLLVVTLRDALVAV